MSLSNYTKSVVIGAAILFGGFVLCLSIALCSEFAHWRIPFEVGLTVFASAAVLSGFSSALVARERRTAAVTLGGFVGASLTVIVNALLRAQIEPFGLITFLAAAVLLVWLGALVALVARRSRVSSADHLAP